MYKINESGTIASLSESTVSTGVTPADIVIAPNDNYAYVIDNLNKDTSIIIYAINNDGTLTSIDSPPMKLYGGQLE